MSTVVMTVYRDYAIGKVMENAKYNRLSISTLKLVSIFILLDLAAVALYGFYNNGTLTSRFFNISRDRGLAESLSYVKLGLVVYMFTQWRKARRELVLLAWTVFFTVLLLDDSLGLHELLGKLFLAILPLKAFFGADAKDISELLGSALTDGSALAFVGYSFLKAPRDLRKDSIVVFLGLLPLVLAGTVLDFFHSQADMEQYGEMLGATILFAVVHLKFRSLLASGVIGKAFEAPVEPLRRAA